jgi:hypothetical protein
MGWPRGANVGDCVIKTLTEGAARSYEVMVADPVIEISQEFLESELNSDVVMLDGDVFTIKANRTVVYRIDRDSYDPLRRTYLAEWPD